MAITKIIISKTAHVDLGNKAGISPGVTVEVDVEPNQTATEALAEGVEFVNNALLDQLAIAFERMPKNRLGNWYEVLGCPPSNQTLPAVPKVPNRERSPFAPEHRGMLPTSALHIVGVKPSTTITFVDDPDYNGAEDVGDDFPDDADDPGDLDGLNEFIGDEDDTRDASDAPAPELEPIDDADDGCDEDELDIQRAEGEGMTKFVWNADMYVYTLRVLAKEHGQTMPFGVNRDAAVAFMREHFSKYELPDLYL